jgi:hypothetical protein
MLQGFSGSEERNTLIAPQDKPNSRQLSNNPRVMRAGAEMAIHQISVKDLKPRKARFFTIRGLSTLTNQQGPLL